ncbi:MAG: HEAT repeat domain-containing protein [Deltaproteobacteria bacterium]|nr:HEAT repeat domain-containing protein [Deltaproteobacteria bacterium]
MNKRLFTAIIATLSLLWAQPAQADRIDRLVRILKTDSSYKVRMQVAIALGKLKAKQAVGALIYTLRDPNQTVQGVAAAALGQIGDRRALSSLRSLKQRTKNSFVRKQAARAIGIIDGGGGSAPPPNARFYVTIGKLSNKSGKGGGQLSKAFGAALRKEFSRVSGVATRWYGGGKPTASQLRKRRMKGFVIDGSILSLSHKQSGGNIEISCSIRVSLATYPGNSMKAFYSGGASTAVSARYFNPSQAFSVYKDLVDGAATGAKQHIVRSFLAHQ